MTIDVQPLPSTSSVFGSYVDGKWLRDGAPVDVVDPSTARPFAKVATIGASEMQAALKAAETAFHLWRQKTAMERANLLLQVAGELARRKAEIAHAITLENGKPLAQSEGEVGMTIDHLRWFAEEGRRIYGRTIPHQVAGKRHMTIKTPIGVVGAIAPWNFPLVLAVRKVAPAMAAGCSVILKPAMQTPICCILLAECMEAAGIPPGTFQVVLGDAAMISAQLMASPICRKISFTGSTQVGKLLIRAAAETVKPLSLELGGLAPVLVFADCDLDVAVRETLVAKFRNSGQSCIAANRIYVERSIYREFTHRFVEGVKKLKLGPGLEPATDVGPVIHEAALHSALAQIDDAVRRGAHVLVGGKRLAGSPGFFLEPTVLEDVADQSLCMREETFAPIAPIAPFDTEEEAIDRANRTEYGLSAYAMTRDLARMFRLSERIEAGTLAINDGAPTVSTSPFGGVKQSGWGRELGSEGLDEFLETKHLSIGNLA